MRYITDDFVLRSAVTINGKLVDQDFRVRDFLRHIVTVGVQFNSNYEWMRVQGRVLDALQNPDYGPVALEVGDWEKILAAVQNPQPLQGFTSYPIQPACRCEPFLEAIIAAKTEPEPPPVAK